MHNNYKNYINYKANLNLLFITKKEINQINENIRVKDKITNYNVLIFKF